tara:strand:+ start:1343 stop:2596 length:1254 start_codon:yes stop_codon:yes gene_type:complete
MRINKKNIGIIGIGYVGLPLALSFSKFFNVIAFDTNKTRIRDLNLNKDLNNQFKKLKKHNIKYTSNNHDLSICNIFIITVPTPTTKNKLPDLSILKNATILVSKYLKKNDYVIYESTVYPGTTEEVLIPILENKSKLKLNHDFYCGYSPERINPGGNYNDISKIIKITSGSSISASNFIDELYKKIIKAGTFKAKNIKIAEAAKVIENCQRDINIAFINELFLIFNKLNINIYDVLNASRTKWNFLDFKPGLVGGHCIGVDPYYLTYISKKKKYKPDIILSGRKINDNLYKSLARNYLLNLSKKNLLPKKSKVLIMGFTFKEDCPDIRNTQIINFVNFLKQKVKIIDIYDPIANKVEVKKMYNISLLSRPKLNFYDSVVILLSHKFFIKMGIKNITKFGKKNLHIYDFKNTFNMFSN